MRGVDLGRAMGKKYRQLNRNIIRRNESELEKYFFTNSQECVILAVNLDTEKMTIKRRMKIIRKALESQNFKESTTIADCVGT
jgi:cytidylate kinase